MGQFFVDDLCHLKKNPRIKGTVSHTWRDIDQEPFLGRDKCYVHKHMPSDARDEFYRTERPPTGYVILGFTQPFDHCCLIWENSLRLIDRALAVGDVVKRKALDAQSGIIISTSVWCNLQPTFDIAKFRGKRVPPTSREQVQPSVELGSPPSVSTQLDKSPGHSKEKQDLHVPAQELKFWKRYREEDFIVYQGWIGAVKDIYDEVAVRLNDGSVVVVENPVELEETACFAESEEQIRMLTAAGYLEWGPRNSHWKTWPAEPCYPGQTVSTKKGNLRRGRWIFGAYDPSISPTGTVVGVRCVQIEIAWAFPNVLMHQTGNIRPVPPGLLDHDVLESGDIKVYDMSRVPKSPPIGSIPYACHCPDVSFGVHVRFKDEAGAAVKYDGSENDPDKPHGTRESADERASGTFHRIPRTATQGYDMNVLQVTESRTIVMVQWQDGKYTEEKGVSLVPYLNVDDHDVWPGEIVSLKDGEESTEGTEYEGSIRASTVGVVQSTNALERIAEVRWFESPDVVITGPGESVLLSSSRLGNISNKFSEVSLFDIVAYPALAKRRGDMALIVPEPVHANNSAQASGIHYLIDSIRSGIGFSGDFSWLMRRPLEATIPSSTAEYGTNAPEPIDWFGEIVNLNLEGQLTVRLGALRDVREITLPLDRVIVVASSDDSSSIGSESEEDESGFSDEMSMSDSSIDTAEAIDLTVEYEGGTRLDADNDDNMWSTDDEDAASDMSTTSDDPDAVVRLASQEIKPPSQIQDPQSSRVPVTSDSHRIGAELRFSSYPTMPSPFAVLGDPAPADHHFFNHAINLSAPLMRRISKEHKIMQSSLPDGIFVRTWDTRLDLLRVLIIGPRNTPYELAPFVMDFQFSTDFPKISPSAFFHSWTGGVGRINPNLYEDGKICLSLLGTWPADERNESWTANGSSMLQILVSLMGLVLVKEPYYNEAGFDVLVGTEESRTPSALYTEKAFVMSRGFIRIALIKQPGGLTEIIHWLYLSSQSGPSLLSLVVDECKALLPNDAISNDMAARSTSGNKPSVQKISSGASVLLRRTLQWLQRCLDDDLSLAST